MRARLSLATVLLFATAAWGAFDDWPLKQVFGVTNIGMVQTSRQAVVEFCPDDTCLRFVLPGRDALPVLHDFVFLYLALVENYDVENRKAPSGERYFATILDRRRGSCRGDEGEVARCALKTLAERLPIQGYVIRPEEGWQRTRPFDFRAKLRASGF